MSLRSSQSLRPYTDTLTFVLDVPDGVIYIVIVTDVSQLTTGGFSIQM